MNRNDRLLAELEQVRKASPDGRLHPEPVVEYARNPTTALHAEFEWDDGIAGDAWRLEQASRLIRAIVIHVGEGKKVIRAFLSIPTDRLGGGGYRTSAEAIGNPSLRAELLNEAVVAIEMWRARYNSLIELAPIFEAIGRTIAPSGKIVPKKKRRKAATVRQAR